MKHKKLIIGGVIFLVALIVSTSVFYSIAKKDDKGNSKEKIEKIKKDKEKNKQTTGNSNAYDRGKKEEKENVKRKGLENPKMNNASNQGNQKERETEDDDLNQIKAEKFKENKKKVSKSLKEVAKNQNQETRKVLEEIAQEQEEEQDDVGEALEEVQGRGGLKTFFIGADYKNLGQLRKSVVHNRNQIRKLTQLMNQVEGEEAKQQIQAQIETLNMEQEQIKDLIKESESQFSLLGWMAKLVYGYKEEPIDDADTDDVEDSDVDEEKEEYSEEEGNEEDDMDDDDADDDSNQTDDNDSSQNMYP